MKTWMRASEAEEQIHRGLVVGCEDGTLYVFHHRLPSPPPDAAEPAPEVIQPLPLKGSTKHSRYSFQSGSRSNSPSTTPAPLLISPRARVVSGVSAEQVEAPKNYVDFDDEPDKLKDMLKGKNPSTRTLSDTGSERTASVKSPTPPTLPLAEPSPTRRKELSKVLINVNPSNSWPFSNPASPRDRKSPDLDSSDDLELQYHVIPRTHGTGNAVESISILIDSFICIILQESG
jgi:hypothetical protein